MSYKAVYVGIQENESRGLVEKWVMNIINENDIISGVNHEGSNDDTYNINFDIELDSNHMAVDRILSSINELVDYMETETYE